MVPENIHTHTTGGISEFRRGGGGLHRLEFRGHGGIHWTRIPKAWGEGVQESNFQFRVVKSLKGKLIKNELSKDDDSLETRSTQLTRQRHFNGHGQ